MKLPMERTGTLTFAANVIAGTALLAALYWLSPFALVADRTESKPHSPPSLSDAAKQRRTLAQGSAERYSVTIRPGPPTPRLQLDSRHEEGATIQVACSTCHANRRPEVANRQTSDLDEFHQGLSYSHNSLSCLSCHNPDDYDTLRLADGTAIAYADVMTLCAQCHGPAYRDYQHGAHGGMTGYWDLSRGPRQRNNCVDCHHPHAPKFPSMQPTFKPRDRFLGNLQDSTSHE